MGARRFAVMGFTEAELGFVVAALFAAIAGLTLTQQNDQAGQVGRLTEERDKARKDAKDAQDALNNLRGEMAVTIKELKELREKTSKKIPNCSEKGESSDPIGEVTVRGATRYELDGRLVGIDEVLRHFSERVEKSRDLKCRFVLITRASPEVGSVDHVTAVRPLRNVFDVSDRAH